MKFRIFILMFSVCSCAKISFGSDVVAPTSENNFKLKAVFERLPKTDANGDGILTLPELRQYVEVKFRDRATSRSNLYMSQFFKYEPTADANKDGVLTKHELLYHLRDPIS